MIEMSIQTKAALSEEQLRQYLEKMVEIRVFEETIQSLYDQGEIYGTMHLCTGEEATAIGGTALLEKTDWITSTHRNHGHCIGKGTSVRGMLAEMMGRTTGTNGGKGGSMHIADMAVGNLGSNGIVGAGFPIATGAALSAKMQGTGQVVVCFAGDGATNEGSFHEALNLASIWQLPVIFFIENNHYAMSSPIEKMVNIDHLSERGAAYGIPGVTIDGNDLLAVLDAMNDALAYVRGGEGPVLLEAMTYRHAGHSKSDKNLYRTEAEIKEWQKANDPILRWAEKLQAAGLAVDLDQLYQEKRTELLELVAEVRRDPFPEAMALYEHVYAEAEV